MGLRTAFAAKEPIAAMNSAGPKTSCSTTVSHLEGTGWGPVGRLVLKSARKECKGHAVRNKLMDSELWRPYVLSIESRRPGLQGKTHLPGYGAKRMCPTRKVRKGLACGRERNPHIRPDYTRFEGPHQAAVVLAVKGEGLPTLKLLQKKVAVGLHVLGGGRCVTRFQSACHDKPHAPGGLDRTLERHSASTGRGSGVGVTKIRHSCDWDMNFQPMQRPIAWAGTSKQLCYLFPVARDLVPVSSSSRVSCI